MKSPWFRFPLSLVAVVLLLSCASQRIDTTSSHDQQIDFDSYNRYVWIEPSEEYEGWRPPQHMDIRLRRVIDDIMADKGYQRAQAVPTADLLFVYYASTQTELRVGGTPMGLFPGWSTKPGFNSPHDPSDVRRYDKGTVMLDMIDKETGQIVWSGQVTSAISSENPSSTRLAVVAKRMLENFPPQ